MKYLFKYLFIILNFFIINIRTENPSALKNVAYTRSEIGSNKEEVVKYFDKNNQLLAICWPPNCPR